MKTSSSKTIAPVAALNLFLPLGILDYFTLVNPISQDTCLLLYLEEKPIVPPECSHLHLHSKGFLPEIEVQDFPIRGKAVYLRIKRRRWEDLSTGQTYSRDWSLVATGTRITAEFGTFLNRTNIKNRRLWMNNQLICSVKGSFRTPCSSVMFTYPLKPSISNTTIRANMN